MIVILSSEGLETTTDQVIDWLDALGGDWVRLNAEDLLGEEACELRFDTSGGAVLRLGRREVCRRDVGAVWFRRWQSRRASPIPGLKTFELQSSVNQHLGREMHALNEAVFRLLGDVEWLTTLREASLPKLEMLQAAAQSGLLVPATAVVNRKEGLQAFKDSNGRIITKCIGDADFFSFAGRNWGMYTAEVTQADIDAAPQVFFPTLVQERLEKAWEIRAFYLDGELHAMAIFSQADPQTESDFRRYNHSRPNRNVPYELPPETVEALRRFAKFVGLSTGSFDLVRTPEGRHVFLEVNPGGQFGVVSHCCNVSLERRVAEALLRREERSGRKSARSLTALREPAGGGPAEETGVAVVEAEPDCDTQAEQAGDIAQLFTPPVAEPLRQPRYPIGYQLMQPMGPGKGELRVAKSAFHRASYACYKYSKPISRPINFEAPTPGATDGGGGRDR